MREVVKNIMTREVITIDDDRSVMDAAKLMTTNQVSSLIVEKSQNALGLSQKEILLEKYVQKISFPPVYWFQI